MSFIEYNGETVYVYLSQLDEYTEPVWGKMTAWQMLEHLILTFRLSLGEEQRESKSTEEEIIRSKKFLMSDRPMPRDFKAFFITDDDLEYEFESFDEARDVLIDYVDKFELHYQDNDSTCKHPIFGELNGEEWRWFHRKHMTHHLKQFDLL